MILNKFRTYTLAKTFYQECQELKFKPPMKDQFERALLSIVLNLSEGSGKMGVKDRRRFYSISLGSLREVQAILDLVGAQKQLAQADKLGAHLYRLIQNPGRGPQP